MKTTISKKLASPRARKILTPLLGVSLFLGGALSARADLLDSILKVGGVTLVVNQFGGQINKVLNTVTGQNKLEDPDIITKVVPVLSAGSRSAIGIVQVAGPREAIDRTKAVAQLQTEVRSLGKLQARILIPIDSNNLSTIRRVPGVGVSAIVDIKL